MPLRLKNICKSFGEKQVLTDFTLEAADGERICILGPSGGGKTTLLNIIAGLMPPDSGTVQLPEGKISYVFQEYRLLPWLNAEENITAAAGCDRELARHMLRAMELGKHAGMEVGGACSVQECWDLVRTAQRTGMGCMLLENCCYNREEMALLNMVRDGLFGELVHVQGGYEHDLRDEIGLGDVNRHYRQHNFASRNGELYPTHELGPIGMYLDLNGNNRMVSLVSMASKAAGLGAWLRENRQDRPDLQKRDFLEGDVVTTMIRCARGETILLTHDCTLPRPYSRGGRIQGTMAIWMEDNRSIYVDGVTPHLPKDFSHSWESDAPYMDRYESALWKEYREFGLRGGHGGMDYLVLRGFIEAIQQGTPMPIDVYDTAALMCITPLSEQSIACGSTPVAIPDFTEGRWLTDRPRAEGPYRLAR